MTPIWQLAAWAALACAILMIAWGFLALSRWVGESRAVMDALTRRVDGLSLQVRALEPQNLKRAHAKSAGPAPSVARPGGKRRFDAPPSPSAAERTLIAVPSLATLGSESAASEAVGELSRRFAALWELADSGASAGVIAATTGHPIGQVELILGLRRTSESAATAEAPGTPTHA